MYHIEEIFKENELPEDLIALLKNTYPEKNWMFLGTMDLEEIREGCEKANALMRQQYGSFKTSLFEQKSFETEIKELVLWMALFPERNDELTDIAFGEDPERVYGIVFKPKPLDGCRLGDELPLPSMVSLMNAILFRDYTRREEKDLAKALIG